MGRGVIAEIVFRRHLRKPYLGFTQETDMRRIFFAGEEPDYPKLWLDVSDAGAPLTCSPLPHDGPRRRRFVPAHLEREHDQIVVARLHRAQVQPLHNGNPAPQENLMGPRGRRAVLLRRYVVHADQYDSTVRKQLRRVWGDVGEIPMKLG